MARAAQATVVRIAGAMLGLGRLDESNREATKAACAGVLWLKRMRAELILRGRPMLETESEAEKDLFEDHKDVKLVVVCV